MGTRGRLRGALVLAGVAALGGCEGRRAELPAATAPFSERAAEVGLDFVHFNGMTGELFYPEMMGPGGALIDFDGDGDLDLYLVQGAMLDPGRGPDEAIETPGRPLPRTDRLYRNELASAPGGKARLRFVDATAAAELGPGSYGMGVAAGDFDRDGWTDLYVTAFGPNRLLRNLGDGRFRDVTREAGVGDARWSVPALFFDFDRDGWPDLYVGNYLDYTLASHRQCRDPAGAPDYCGPTAYPGVTDRLFRNRGDGTFDDVSGPSGVGRPPGRTLGAIALDADADGWPDLYVANDGEPNFLWRNRGDGSFEEQALASGCALDADGRPQASMGVTAGDFDNDGDDDLFMTHLTGETNTLFESTGGGHFEDVTRRSGLGPPSLPLTGFGTAWLDFDNDGWLDLLTVNGAVRRIGELARAGDPYPLAQRRQLFRNLGDGRFEDLGERSGAPFAGIEVGRGAAFGDLDNDGDADVLVVNNNGPARLLINEVGASRPWIGLAPAARGDEPAGVRWAVASGGAVRFRTAARDGSYASSNDPRVLFGLGEAAPGSLEIRAQRGRRTAGVWRGLSARRYLTLPVAPAGRETADER